MNNYRNYGTYGNRRVAGGMGDCGCGGRMMPNQMHRMPEADCGCKKNEGMQEKDCGCKKEEVMRETDCGCKKEETMWEKDCGCKKEEKMKETGCGCAVESMYREVMKSEPCCEADMPGNLCMKICIGIHITVTSSGIPINSLIHLIHFIFSYPISDFLATYVQSPFDCGFGERILFCKTSD